MKRGGGNKGQGGKGKGGKGKGAYWVREVRPATSGVAEWYSPPLPLALVRGSNQIDSNPNRVLTRAVRSQLDVEPRRLAFKSNSSQGGYKSVEF